jgi:DNA polymerase I
MSEMKKLAIIDGKSVFYRGYYAMPSLTTADGTPTGGVYGFAAMSLELIKKLKPDYVAVAWDMPKTNIRKRLAIYPAYKAGRKPAPPDFYAQIPVLHELLKAFGWPLYELDDYEADDIMCTLAKEAHGKGIETMLITSDLDALQCLDTNTHVYALKKGFSNIERFDPEYYEAKVHIKTSQFLDLKALKGDSSDNIPGVPGIGEKTAVDLLQKYETLEGIYENLWEIKDSVRKKLELGKDSAYMSRELGRLYDDAPIPLDLEATDTHKLDVHALKALLTKLEFRSLLRNLPDYMQVDAEEEKAPDAPGERVQLNEITPLKTTLIDSDKKLAELKISGEVLIHSFAAGAHGKNPQLLILADHKTVYVIDLPKLNAAILTSNLQRLTSTPVVGYDVKSSLQVLLELGVNLPRVAGDVLIGGFLIDPLRRARALTDMAVDDLYYNGSSLDDLPVEELVQKAGDIAAVIWALKSYQDESISELTKVIELSDKVELPVIPVLAEMEYEGIGIDPNYLEKFAIELGDEISDIEQMIYGLADSEFNLNSPQQVSEVLFEALNMPSTGIKRLKSGFYSTDIDTLTKLKDFPIIKELMKYREYSKLKGTYADVLPSMVDKNNRIHTTYDLTGAQTGRLSSMSPNLQHIPTRTELGKRIRTAFIAKPGHVFVSADYSQFELRIAAALSDDEEMIKAFNADLDIHQLTAAAILGIKPEDVTKEMRYRAKAVNFGILYGQGSHGLATGTGMSFGEAKDFIAKYFEVRPKLKEYMDGLRDQAKNKGFVETLLGRRRPTPDAQSSNHMVREAALRQAINMPIQGTAADLTKLAMVAVSDKFKVESKKFKDMPKQLLQIHDSILIECSAEDADEVSTILKETMENIYPKLGVNLKADISTGINWGEL